MKGLFMQECELCGLPPANFLNQYNKLYYCKKCAELLNDINKDYSSIEDTDLCIEITNQPT